MPREPTVSIQVLWPFIAASGADPRIMAALAELGIHARDLADRDVRLSARRVMAALGQAITDLNDPTLGLRAGEFQEGTFDVIEYAWRHERDLGAAMRITERFGRLLHEGMDTWLEVDGPIARWCCSVREPQPPAANDFLVAVVLTFTRRHMIGYAPPHEVHLMHDEPVYAAEYARYFQAPVRFGMPYNAIVFDSASLTVPLRNYNSALAEAFGQHTESLARSLEADTNTTSRVREALLRHRPLGSLDMNRAARILDVSTATLRRRLDDEGESFSGILEALRREAAEQHLGQPQLSITDVAFLLGFSDVRAFCRAFKRWTGKTPSAFRGENEDLGAAANHPRDGR